MWPLPRRLSGSGSHRTLPPASPLGNDQYRVRAARNAAVAVERVRQLFLAGRQPIRVGLNQWRRPELPLWSVSRSATRNRHLERPNLHARPSYPRNDADCVRCIGYVCLVAQAQRVHRGHVLGRERQILWGARRMPPVRDGTGTFTYGLCHSLAVDAAGSTCHKAPAGRWSRSVSVCDLIRAHVKFAGSDGEIRFWRHVRHDSVSARHGRSERRGAMVVVVGHGPKRLLRHDSRAGRVPLWRTRVAHPSLHPQTPIDQPPASAAAGSRRFAHNQLGLRRSPPRTALCSEPNLKSISGIYHHSTIIYFRRGRRERANVFATCTTISTPYGFNGSATSGQAPGAQRHSILWQRISSPARQPPNKQKNQKQQQSNKQKK